MLAFREKDFPGTPVLFFCGLATEKIVCFPLHPDHPLVVGCDVAHPKFYQIHHTANLYFKYISSISIYRTSYPPIWPWCFSFHSFPFVIEHKAAYMRAFARHVRFVCRRLPILPIYHTDNIPFINAFINHRMSVQVPKWAYSSAGGHVASNKDGATLSSPSFRALSEKRMPLAVSVAFKDL